MTMTSTLGLFLLAMIALATLLWLACAGWVIRSVRRSDHPKALLWSVGALFLGYFAPILYIVTQNSARSAVYGTRAK